MKGLLTIVGATVALLLPAAAAQAGVPDGPGPWTDAFEPGQTNITNRTDGTPVPPPRNNPQNAVGVAETPGGLDPGSTPPTVFTSLGMGGEITLRFDNPACNVAGSDVVLDIREVTYAPPDPGYPEETARVLVSQDGTNYVQAAAKINRDSMVNVPAGISFVRYVKIIDTTNPALFAGRKGNPGDGIDIDGVRAVNTANCGQFTCSASAVRVTSPPPVPITIEPSVANGQSAPCATDSDSVGNVGPITPGTVFASLVTANTQANPANPRAVADSGLFGVLVGLLGASASSMTAHAEANCTAGSPFPTLTGNSSIVNLAIAGQFITTSNPQTIPIPVLGTVFLNRQQTVAQGGQTRLIVRAFEFVPAAAVTGLVPKIVLGEAIANFSGEPCPG